MLNTFYLLSPNEIGRNMVMPNITNVSFKHFLSAHKQPMLCKL
ncbi:hypothetical protein HMPREF6745_2816 [Prevotella sp. oral taxon 472 str. F0295]|nr:hypothetical protein HMPREF6745_2816 [Prevotella sp. oral taxon 472 str. F0295]